MVAKQKENNKECVSLQLTLCGEVLRAVKKTQEDYYNTTGLKLSKQRAVFKLILSNKI